MRTTLPLLLPCLLLSAAPLLAAPADVVYADFEGDSYGDWVLTGTAFGKGPAAGTLPNQMPVSGFAGKRLVNSYHGGDGTTGTLTSPAFKIERKFIRFLIGGGGHVDRTCMNLVVDGKAVRTATGPREGSEQVDHAFWDVTALAGKSAKLQIVDNETGGWGHILIDHIVFTDTKPEGVVSRSRDLVAKKRYLHFPVKNGAFRRVSVSVEGKPEQAFTIELADGKPDWWAFLDLSDYAGKKLTIEADRLSAGSEGLEAIRQSDNLEGATDLYREKLRPQLHFSSRRGWLNDPNGLVYFDGQYHLFYQHNPYGTGWGNMHWGHAVSKDMLHWQERPIALYPDKLGPMFSGSAVVDWKNTSGLGKDGKPPLVLFYTAAGNPSVQCLAFSNDQGKSWPKYTNNPIIKNIAPGDRDPKVIWHLPSKHWVLVLYVGLPGKGRGVNHTIHFFTSPNLREWTYQSQVEGFFECPDFFELRENDDPKRAKWVLTAASSEYQVGTFDGKRFKPETAKLPGQRGRGFYAAQTFSDIPPADGRRIQIGWGQMPSPGMPFSQMMCFPCELSLKATPEGPRLAWQPIKEITALRTRSHRLPAGTLAVGDNPLSRVTGELLEIRSEIEPGKATGIDLEVRGVAIHYDVKKQEISVAGHKAPAPLREGKLKLIALIDRTSITVFASDGLAYIPMPVIPKADQRSLGLHARGGEAKVVSLEVHELGSIWGRKKE